MAEPMTNERLAVLLDEMNRTAVGYLSDEVSVDQDSNLDRYLGKPYGDEEEGRSNAMSLDVAEVVDWALPDLLEEEVVLGAWRNTSLVAVIVPVPVIWSGALLYGGWESFFDLDTALLPPEGYLVPG